MARRSRLWSAPLILVLAVLLALGLLWYADDVRNRAVDDDGRVPAAEAQGAFGSDPRGMAPIRFEDEPESDAGPAASQDGWSDLRLVRVGESAGTVEGRIRFEDGETQPWCLEDGQLGVGLRVPRRTGVVETEDGWVAVPSGIQGDSQEVVGIFPATRYRFVFRRGSLPLGGGEVTILVGRDFAWSGRTDVRGELETPPLLPGAVHVLFQDAGLWASWSAPSAYGPREREIVLRVDSVREEGRVVFLDAATTLPVEGVRLRWSGMVPLGPPSGPDGALRVPPRNSEIDVLEAVADSYSPSVISLEEESPPFYLSRVQSFRIRVESESGESVVGARCYAVPRATGWDLRALAEMDYSESGQDGMCEVRGDPERDVLVVYHEDFGGGTFDLRSANGPGGDPPTVVLKRSPLELESSGWSPSKDQVEATTVFGDRPEILWEREGKIVIPDAFVLERIDLRGDGFVASIRRSPKLMRAKLDFDGLTEQGMSGTLSVEPIAAVPVRGRTVDLQGRARPWSVFQLEPIRFRRVRRNLELHPGYQGYEPSTLAGWVYDGSGPAATVCSDGKGEFDISSMPPGEYEVRFRDPDGGGYSVPFGLEGYQSSVFLNGTDELMVRFPNSDYLDLDVLDAVSGRPVGDPALEITYDSFLGGGLRVMRRQSFSAGVRTWVSWQPGVKMRICATGYEPMPIGQDMFGERRTIRLQPFEEMILDFGRLSEPDPGYQVVFLRPPADDGFREALGSRRIEVGGDATVEVAAPFPGCILSIRRIHLDTGDDPVLAETEFVPGGRFVIE